MYENGAWNGCSWKGEALFTRVPSAVICCELEQHTLLLQYFLKKWWCVVLRDEVTHKVALQACKSQINYYPNHSTTQIWSKAKIQPIIYLFTISHYFTLQTSRFFYRLRYLRTYWSLIQDANVFAVIWNDTNLTVKQDRVETSHDAP